MEDSSQLAMKPEEDDAAFGPVRPCKVIGILVACTPTPCPRPSSSSSSSGGETEDGGHQQANNHTGNHHKKAVARCQPFANHVHSISQRDVVNFEQTLQRLVRASAILSAPLQTGNGSPQIIIELDPNTSATVLFAAALASFRQGLSPARAYIQQLPAYGAVPDSDRCLLFSKSCLLFLMAQLCLPEKSTFSLNDAMKHNRELFFTRFPTFCPFGETMEEIAMTMHLWTPTIPEISLLFSFLFFQESALDELQHPRLVQIMCQRLKEVLHAVLRQHTGYELRLRYFMRAHDLLLLAIDQYSEAAAEVVNSRNDLPTVDRLWSEIYVQKGLPRPDLMAFLKSDVNGRRLR